MAISLSRETFMNPLGLTPLPSTRQEETSDSFLMERDGFVDEAIVTELVAGRSIARYAPVPSDLALSADDMDFAGWCIAPALPLRAFDKTDIVSLSGVNLNEPIVGLINDTEPDGVSSHRVRHRGWLAGLVGILSTLLGCMLFLSLSEHPNVRLEGTAQPQTPLESAASMNTSAPMFLPPVSSNTFRH